MRKAMYTVLLAGLFLLMLSSLVVSPETPADPPPMRTQTSFHAVFRPLVSAILPDAAAAPVCRPEMRLLLSLMPLSWLCCAPLRAARDANGRVLTAARYENSVYQLFRAEVAGG